MFVTKHLQTQPGLILWYDLSNERGTDGFAGSGMWGMDRIGLLTWCHATHHTTRHNTPIHNILSIALQLSISQKALGTLPDDDNVITKHVGATIHN
jgi:hypothetical protein